MHSSAWAASHLLQQQLQQESQLNSVRLQLQLKPMQICLLNVVVPSRTCLVARSQHRSNALHAPAEIVSGCSNHVTHVCDICAMLWLMTTMLLALHVGDVAATSHGACVSESASESVTHVDDDCARHRNDVASTTTTSVAAAAADATEICTSRMMLRMSCGSARLSCRCSDSPCCDVANQFALYLFPALSPAHGPCRCRVDAHRVHVHVRDPDHVHVRACSHSPYCSLWCDDGDDRSAS